MSLFSKLKGTTDTQFSIGPAATQGFFNGDLKIDSIIPATLLNINGNTAITGVSNPAFDSYTSLMLHMNGTNLSTTFTDEIGHTMTAVNDAKLTTAQYEFATASGLFIAASGDYLHGVADSHFDFGTGDFTIDFWLRFNGLPGNQISLYGGGAAFSDGFGITYVPGSGFYLYFNGGGYGQSWSPSNLVWYHFAVVRSGTDVKTFINGSQIGSTLTGRNENLTTGMVFHIGGGVSGLDGFNGWLDEFRISKGIARWTSNFTAPSSPYAPSGTAHTLTVSTLDGMLKGSSGVVGVASLADGMTYSANTLGNSYLDQSVKVAATPTFAGIIIADGGTVGQAAGPLMKFNDTSNMLNITGCKVGVGMFTSLDPISTLHVRDMYNSQGSLKYQLAIEDNTVYSSSPVSGISFRVKADATPNIYDVSGIHGGKENTTSGNYAGFLSLHTRAAAGNNVERIRIKSDGLVGIGCTPANSHTLDIYVPTGSGDPVVAVGKDQTNKFGTLGFSDGLDALYLQGGLWGGVTRPLVLQGGGGDVYTEDFTDWSGSVSCYGWSSYTTKIFYYKKIGKLLFVEYYIGGTSSQTYANISLPYTKGAGAIQSIIRACNDGNWINGLAIVVSSTAQIDFYSSAGGGTWVNSGTKVVTGQFWMHCTA